MGARARPPVKSWGGGDRERVLAKRVCRLQAPTFSGGSVLGLLGLLRGLLQCNSMAYAPAHGRSLPGEGGAEKKNVIGGSLPGASDGVSGFQRPRRHPRRDVARGTADGGRATQFCTLAAAPETRRATAFAPGGIPPRPSLTRPLIVLARRSRRSPWRFGRTAWYSVVAASTATSASACP